ncbi:MAG TPA: SRPBCC family protein, partial [Pseudonocardia sp.]
MITEGRVEVAASAAAVWSVFADVERWSEWTGSVDRLVALDGPGLEVGRRFAISQPRFPRLVWEVTEVD